MTNIIKFQNNTALSADVEKLSGLNTIIAGGSGSGQADLLRLLRDGMWVYGAENIEPEEESQWAVNPFSFRHGYIAWHDSKVEGECMVPFTQALPVKESLPDVTEGYSFQMSVGLQCTSGEDEGTEVEFKTTSVGGKRALSELATKIAQQQQEGHAAVVPIVELAVDHYKHKTYGKIYTPVLKVVDWVTMDGEAPAAKQAEEPEPTPAPKKRGRPAKAKKAENVEEATEATEDDAPPPPRRRRRA